MFVVPPSGRGFPPPPPRASGLIRLAIIKPSFPCQIFHVCVYVPNPHPPFQDTRQTFTAHNCIFKRRKEVDRASATSQTFM